MLEIFQGKVEKYNDKLSKAEELLKEFGIEKNVIFTGNVNYENLPYYYSASDLFVHPSYVESMGRVILEAQSSGTPVIATNIGGIPEALCKNGGILIPPKEPKSLAESIINLIDNQETLIKMAKYGREFVLDKFEFWKQEEKLIEFYNNTIQNS